MILRTNSSQLIAKFKFITIWHELQAILIFNKLRKANAHPKFFAKKLLKDVLFCQKICNKRYKFGAENPCFRKFTGKVETLSARRPEFTLSEICNRLSKFCRRSAAYVRKLQFSPTFWSTMPTIKLHLQRAGLVVLLGCLTACGQVNLTVYYQPPRSTPPFIPPG